MVRGAERILRLDSHGFGGAFGTGPLGVQHTLVGHPLLELEAVAELADRFPGHIERHRSDLPVVMPGGAPEIEGPPSETVRGIDHNGCWMVFWYLEQDPDYKALLDHTVDEAESHLHGDERTCQREAFLFVSAANAVTPVHFDPEHNFLLQIRGTKGMNVCPFPSSETERRELDRYFDGGHRNLESVPSDGPSFGLDPGKGVYVPPFMPHWVQNGPQASISLSITFRTPASRRAERVHRINARMRQLGLSPRPPGASPVLDRAKEGMWLTLRGPKQGIGSLRRTARVPHAH